MVAYSNRIAELRRTRKLSQARLAEVLGVTQGAVSLYEAGQNLPSKEILDRLADYFDVTLDYLLGRGEGSNTPMPAYHPALPAIIERMLQKQRLRNPAQILLFTNGALSADEVEGLRQGLPPSAFAEERLVQFFRKFPLEEIRAYYAAARHPLPQAFQDLMADLRDIIDRVRMSTDGSPEALEFVIQVVKDEFLKGRE